MIVMVVICWWVRLRKRRLYADHYFNHVADVDQYGKHDDTVDQ